MKKLRECENDTLLVALLLQSVWGTLFYWATDETFVNNGYSFIWFYTLYFMAAYFRKYRVLSLIHI